MDVLLALCLSELGQFKEALPGLRKAFNQTADPSLRRLAGLQFQRAYTGLERDDKAVEAALELGRLYPDDPEVLYHGGRLFANFAYLQTLKLRKVAPDSIFMHQAAGEANESQGYYDAASRNTVRSSPSVRDDPGSTSGWVGRCFLAPSSCRVPTRSVRGRRPQRSSRKNSESIPRVRTPPTSWERSIARRARWK